MIRRGSVAVCGPLTAERVRELLYYNPETGKLTWRVAARIRTRIGMRAGSRAGMGYRSITIGRRNYKEHRVVWLHFYGTWPSGPIDHLNGDRSDNRIANLRAADRLVNNQNRVVRGTKQVGPSWIAQIHANGKKLHLGSFPTEDEAHAAYIEAKKKYHPGFVQARYAN